MPPDPILQIENLSVGLHRRAGGRGLLRSHRRGHGDHGDRSERRGKVHAAARRLRPEPAFRRQRPLLRPAHRASAAPRAIEARYRLRAAGPLQFSADDGAGEPRAGCLHAARLRGGRGGRSGARAVSSPRAPSSPCSRAISAEASSRSSKPPWCWRRGRSSSCSTSRRSASRPPIRIRSSPPSPDCAAAVSPCWWSSRMPTARCRYPTRASSWSWGASS